MKKNLLLVFMLVCTATIQAQSFAFERNGAELADNASYTVTEIVTFPILTIESELALANKTANAVNVRVSQTVLQAPSSPDAWLSICFDQCYTTNENKSVTGLLFTGNNSPFHVYFNPVQGHNETVIVKYEVSDVNNPFDKRSVTVTYQYGSTGIAKLTETANINIFGKDGKTFCRYAFGSVASRQLQIFNITGKQIQSINIERSIAIITLSDLQKGIYIYRIIENGKTQKTDKFIIK